VHESLDDSLTSVSTKGIGAAAAGAEDIEEAEAKERREAQAKQRKD